MTLPPINTERLQEAIVTWEATMNFFKQNMEDIKAAHKLTWWSRKDYWANEKLFHKYFTAIIKRRIQLQTALKERNS